MLKLEIWLARTDALLAEEHFDTAAALKLVREIRNQTGPGAIGIAAGQALASLQAMERLMANREQRTAAKQWVELLRVALANSLKQR